MENYFTTSKAIKVFDKIQTKLENFGYKLNRSSDVETYKHKNDVIEFCQKYKFSQFDTNTFGKFSVKDSAPELKICLLIGKDDTNDRLEYDITAILGDNVWAGRDISLQYLVNAYLDDAYSDIANYYADNDLLDLVDNSDSSTPVYENLKNYSDLNKLDKLDKQVKESNDSEALEDLNMKVDTILDALGLADTVADDDDKDSLDDNNTDNNDSSSDDVVDVVDLTDTDSVVTEDTEQTVEDTDTDINSNL